jgi:hypothetical protein
MAPVTVWCFQCRVDYVDEVEMCVDCAGPTIGRSPFAPEEVGGDDDEQLSYEFNAWAVDARARLDAELWNAGLQHAWMAGSLIIREDDEEAVDALVEMVDQELRPTFEPGATLVEYALDDYPDDARERLLHLIDLSGVAHQIEAEHLLLVQERDEAEVDDLFERLVVEEPARLDFGPGIPGVDPLEVVHDVFVSADKLRRNASDAKAKSGFVTARAQAYEIKLPWGYDGHFWRSVLDRCDALQESIETDDRDEIKEHASAIRDSLRTVL